MPAPWKEAEAVDSCESESRAAPCHWRAPLDGANGWANLVDLRGLGVWCAVWAVLWRLCFWGFCQQPVSAWEAAEG